MSAYAAAHANPHGAGDARPTASQIIHDQALKNQLRGKVIVITGATSGIGLETARALSSTGATLILTARNMEKGKRALGHILEQDRIMLVQMDLASLQSVRVGADTILSISKSQVNILINNAGVMGLKDLQLTEDGYELLRGALMASTTLTFHSRVVTVASSAHRSTTLNESDNYNFQKGVYSHEIAYANSNLAKVYLANEIDRRYSLNGIHATSVHPGAINTDISRNLDRELLKHIMRNDYVLKILKSPEQGAATTVLAAVGKEWENKGGRYLEDCEESKRGEDDNQSFGVGYVRQTYDPILENRLWKDSLKMLGLDE
ncbi:unnamed protein product [Penicillium pancosmium]